jgi:hypothetical protein
MLQNSSENNFVFSFNRPLEFHYALITVSLKEYLYEGLKEEGITPSGELTAFVDSMKSKLSRYIKGELEYFFHMNVNFCNGIGQLIYMGFLRDNPEIMTVEDMIEHIEKSELNTMFSYMTKSLYYENENKSIGSVYRWDGVKNNIESMLGIMKKLKFKDAETKQRLIECLENPAETKQRYILLLKQFYDKSYKAVEEEIYEKITPKIGEFIRLFEKNPSKFTLNYLKKDISVFKRQVNAHISYFRFIGSDYWTSEDGAEFLCIGSATVEFMSEIPGKERVLTFLKAVSDKKRMEMIELLSEKPWYVN